MALPAGSLLDRGYFKYVVLGGSIIYILRFVPSLSDDRRLLMKTPAFLCCL